MLRSAKDVKQPKHSSQKVRHGSPDVVVWRLRWEKLSRTFLFASCTKNFYFHIAIWVKKTLLAYCATGDLGDITTANGSALSGGVTNNLWNDKINSAQSFRLISFKLSVCFITLTQKWTKTLAGEFIISSPGKFQRNVINSVRRQFTHLLLKRKLKDPWNY